MLRFPRIFGARAAAWALALGLGMTGCSPSDSDGEAGLLFRYNEASGISSLDPAFARDQAHNWVIRQLYSTLFETDSAGQLRGLLAESWAMAPDGRTAGLRLRPGFTAHEDPCFGGQLHELDAADVVASLRRLADPATASPGSWLIQGLDSVWAARPDSVVFVLHAADPALWSKLSVPYTAVVPAAAITAYGTALSEHPVGSGPFRFKAWQRGQKLVLRRHPHYAERDEAGRQLPYLEAVSIRFTPDRQSAFMAFIQGELDFLTGVDPSYKDQWLDPDGALQPQWRDRFTQRTAPFLNTEYLALRFGPSDPDYLADVRVRRALNWSVDRAGIIRHLKNGLGIPAHGGILPAGMPGYRPAADWATPWTYRPDSARILLTQAGLLTAQGKAKPGVKPLVLSTTASYRDIAEFLQSAWTDLGLPVEVQVLPSATFREDKAQGRLGLYRASWIADYPDPENYLMLYGAPGGPNVSGYAGIPGFREFTAESDPARRANLAAQLDARLHQDAALIPLFYDVSLRAWPKEWVGPPPHPMNDLDLRRVRKVSLRP
ncbi:MAG: ABC transporter substrate-binding protein [Schleiferiaceae bacterium]